MLANRCELRLNALAGVIARVDVVELQGRMTVDLYDRFSVSHGEVVQLIIAAWKVRLPDEPPVFGGTRIEVNDAHGVALSIPR